MQAVDDCNQAQGSPPGVTQGPALDLSAIRRTLECDEMVSPTLVLELVEELEALQSEVDVWKRFARDIANRLENHANRRETVGAIRDVLRRGSRQGVGPPRNLLLV